MYFVDSQNYNFLQCILNSFCFLFKFWFHYTLETVLHIVTEELMQGLCTTAWGRSRGGVYVCVSGGCDSQFMLTMHMCFIPRGGKAERLTPLLPWPALTLRPKCDTSSVRWECMSSVQGNTPGANKDESVLKHN